MKRAHSEQGNGEPQRRRSVQWDEANLEENDKLKAELNPAKIDEPKTPYHGPVDSEDEPSLGEAGMAPLTLDDDAAVEHLASARTGTRSALTSVVSQHINAYKLTSIACRDKIGHPWWPDCLHNIDLWAWAGSNPIVTPPSKSTASGREEREEAPTSHHGWSDSDRGEHSSGAISNGHSSAGGGEEAESAPHRRKEKRRRFEARRRQHYNMRDALKRGKELLSAEPEVTGSDQQKQRVWANGSNKHLE